MLFLVKMLCHGLIWLGTVYFGSATRSDNSIRRDVKLNSVFLNMVNSLSSTFFFLRLGKIHGFRFSDLLSQVSHICSLTN